jgi:hypothetical protein
MEVWLSLKRFNPAAGRSLEPAQVCTRRKYARHSRATLNPPPKIYGSTADNKQIRARITMRITSMITSKQYTY